MSGTIVTALAFSLLGGSIAYATTAIDTAPYGTLADLGVAGESRMVQVAFTIRYRNELALRAFVEMQADPRSPDYHHFLTPSAFRMKFGPDEADEGQVITALQRGGFTVIQTFANHTVIVAQAPAPVAARAFGTEIHEFAQPGYGIRYGNIRPGRIPNDISQLVTGVTGLSNIHAYATHIRYGAPRVPGAADSRARVSGLHGPDGGVGPAVFAAAYSMLGSQGDVGTGRTGAVVIDANFLDSDIASFLSYFGISRTGSISRVQVAGGPGSGLSADSDEATLDVETLASLAPGANIVVYLGKDFSNPANLVTAYNTVVSDDTVEEVNASLGYCETAFGTFPKMVESIALQGSALGITFHASSGDNGTSVYGCATGAHVAVPAAAPHVTAIGGTSLRVAATTGHETAEYAWIDGPYGASGGGVSTIFPLPSYQSAVANIRARGRNVPDVAFEADPNTGVSFYFRGRFQGPIGGTSLASPIFGAAMLQANQLNGGRAGWVTPAIYSTWQKLGYGKGARAYFRDVVTGSNGNAIGTGDKVGAGYDRVTGIGSIIVSNTSPYLHQ